MDSSKHNMQTLFLQLGQPNSPEDTQSFIDAHKGLPGEIPLSQADFWNLVQAAYLQEAIEEDSDWCEIVDELNNWLHD